MTARTRQPGGNRILRIAVSGFSVLCICAILVLNSFTAPDSSAEWLYTVDQINRIAFPGFCILLVLACDICNPDLSSSKWIFLATVLCLAAFTAIIAAWLFGLDPIPLTLSLFAVAWSALLTRMLESGLERLECDAGARL